MRRSLGIITLLLILTFSLNLVVKGVNVGGENPVNLSRAYGLDAVETYKDIIGPVYNPPSPKIGVWHVMVVFIEFTDESHQVSISTIMDKVDNVRRYYSEVSYGKFSLDIDNLDIWIRLNETYSYYGQDSPGTIDENLEEYIDDSLKAADPYIDYRNYDTIYLVHAGDDEAYSGNPDDIWSIATVGKIYINYDGGVDIGVVVVSENDPYGVYAHENGHNLGLPDLYNYQNRYREYVGVWSLMAKGEWKIPPTGFTSVERRWLGWIDDAHMALVARGDMKNITLYPLEGDNPLNMIKMPLSSNYYYTVEYRIRNGTDSSLPMDGIIIARVDESKSSGMGIVRIVDRNDNTLSLDDAAYGEGDTFIDYDDEVAVKIYSVGSNAMLMVMNGLPDLRVKSVNKTYEDGLIKFIIDVENAGSCESLSFRIDTYIDETLHQSIIVNDTISPNGGVYELTLYTDVIAGNHTLGIVLDPNDKVIEKDESNNIYNFTYFEAPLYILDRYEGPEARVDVGTLQNVRLHFSYYENNTSYANKQVIINGETFNTDSEGWVNITVSLNHPGKIMWMVTDPRAYSVIDTPFIIWDKVNIILSTIRDRYDVGSEPLINITAYYAYDHLPFKGDIILNDTLIKNEVGEYWFTVSEIIDHDYGITMFSANKVAIIYDEVIVSLEILDNHIDVGSKPPMNITAYYAYDGEPFNGDILYNDTLVKNNVGKYWYKVVGIDDKLYGLSMYVLTGTSNKFYAIYDKVIIQISLTQDRERFDVGKAPDIGVSAYYAYDETVFQGDIILNDTLIKEEAGRYSYTVESILDNKYGLTIFESNTITIVFDRVIINLEVSDDRINIGSKADITYEAYYELDGEPFQGDIKLNDTLVKDEVGRYWFSVESVNDRLYGLTAFTSNKVGVVYDAVEVVLSVSHERVSVGGEAVIEIEAHYLYDHSKYDGDISLNDTLSKNEVGKYWYGVESAGNDMYGIDRVFYEPVYMIFDKPIIDVSITSITPYVSTVSAKIYSAYDGSTYDNAEVIINGVAAEYVDGLYQAKIYSIMPLQDINVKITAGGVSEEASVRLYNTGNILLILVLIAVAVLVIKKFTH